MVAPICPGRGSTSANVPLNLPVAGASVSLVDAGFAVVPPAGMTTDDAAVMANRTSGFRLAVSTPPPIMSRRAFGLMAASPQAVRAALPAGAA